MQKLASVKEHEEVSISSKTEKEEQSMNQSLPDKGGFKTFLQSKPNV